MSLPKENYGTILTKFNGEKPITFAFEENGEQYMIGSQVKLLTEHFMSSSR